MRRAAARLVVALLLLGGAVATRTDPPRLLSWLDVAVGGGAGVERAATAVPFGHEGQTLDVWRPARTAAARRPVVVFFYGGGWVHGDRGGYAFAARGFARSGFVVVVPDYRKVPAVRFPAFLQDGAAALRWVHDHIAEYGGDPGRVAVAGHSAGAYVAAMLALDPRWTAAEGLSRDFVKAGVGLSGPYDFYPFDDRRSIDAFAGVAEPMMTQPVTFARADAPPLLLVTSGNDTQVRPRNAANLALLLRDKGGRAAFIDYPGLAHEEVAMALSKPFAGKAPVLRDAAAFLHRELPPGR